MAEHTTTATVEDAARVLYESGTGFKLTQGKPWEELTDSSRNSQRRLAQALADAGLLATARTRPTREQIIDALDLEGAFCGSCGREPGAPLWECPACADCLGRYADTVLALLRGGDRDE